MKRYLKLLGISFAIGIALLITKLIFKIDDKVMLRYYWIIGGIVLAVILIVNTIYFFYKTNELKHSMKLFEEMKYKDFVNELEPKIPKIKNKHIKTVMKMNLGAGYLELNEPNKTLSTYETIATDQLKNQDLQLIYWLNTMIAHFKLNEQNKFDELFATHEKLLQQFENSPNYGENINQLYIMKNIFDGDFVSARAKLNELKSKSTNPRFKKEYNRLENMIKQHEK
ncbi:hypothetical protein [uncultured Finegoldia sp.]|uniref:hypothetical protein n=1 Tax=uncultured Finegoldia sp. TaxID=328009 RepID=UPI00260FB5A1|nr:hypothetical protein [uncultured Finegoldia sp.]